MLDLYIFNYDSERDYNLDLRNMNQEVINYVLKMDEIRRELSIFSYYQLIDLLKNKYHLKDFELTFEGKPRIKNNLLYFNISHTEGRVVIAISDQEVGVDVESTNRRVRADLYKKVLTEEEKILYQRRFNNTRYFLKCWVKKEAYLKYMGTGIIRDLNHINSENLSFCEVIEDEDYLIAVYSKVKEAKLIHKSV